MINEKTLEESASQLRETPEGEALRILDRESILDTRLRS